jgi:hypothetical protein
MVSSMLMPPAREWMWKVFCFHLESAGSGGRAAQGDREYRPLVRSHVAIVKGCRSARHAGSSRAPEPLQPTKPNDDLVPTGER